jgi:hypothetical protein
VISGQIEYFITLNCEHAPEDVFLERRSMYGKNKDKNEEETKVLHTEDEYYSKRAGYLSGNVSLIIVQEIPD